METAQLKKTLKLICIVCMAAYVLLAVVGILIFTNVIPPEAYSEALGVTELLKGPEASMYVSILGVIFTISYAIRALFTIPVLRGIKNPSKMKLGIILYSILTVVVLVNVVRSFMGGGDVSTSSVQLFADVCILGMAIQLYRAEK